MNWLKTQLSAFRPPKEDELKKPKAKPKETHAEMVERLATVYEQACERYDEAKAELEEVRARQPDRGVGMEERVEWRKEVAASGERFQKAKNNRFYRAWDLRAVAPEAVDKGH